MESVALIQKPNKKPKTCIKTKWIQGVQIDDHYFNNPPISIKELRHMLENRTVVQFSTQAIFACCSKHMRSKRCTDLSNTAKEPETWHGEWILQTIKLPLLPMTMGAKKEQSNASRKTLKRCPPNSLFSNGRIKKYELTQVLHRLQTVFNLRDQDK